MGSIKALYPERVTPLILAIRLQHVQSVSLLLQSIHMLITDNIWMRETPLEFAQSHLSKKANLESTESQEELGGRDALPADRKDGTANDSQKIIELLEAFDQGGAELVSKVVKPDERLFCHANAHESMSFADEL